MRIHFFCVLILAILTCGLARADAPATQPVSGTRTARQILTVWSKVDVFSGNRLKYFQQNICSELAPDIKNLLHAAPADVTLTLDVQNIGTDGDVVLEMDITLDDKALPAAQEFAKLAVVQFRSDLADQQKYQEADLITELRKHKDDLQVKYSEEKDGIADLQEKLHGLGLIDANPDEVQALAKKLDEQKEQTTIDVAARTARQTVMNDELAKLNAMQEAKKVGDPVAQEMQKLVDLRTDRVNQFESLQKRGLPISPTQSDFSDAEAQLSEAKIQLLERQEAVMQAAGGDLVTDLRRQLMNIEIDQAESESRLLSIDNLAKSLAQAQGYSDQMHTYQEKCEFTQAQLNQIDVDIDRSVMEMRTPSLPTVKVVDFPPTRSHP